MRWENYVLLILLCLPMLCAGQRYVLQPDKSLRITDSTCIRLFVNDEVRLVRGDNCSDNILLSNELSTVSFVNTDADSVDFTFTTPGTYVAFCGSVPGAIAIQSLCFIVEPQPATAIPTLGQWSLISLALLLMIFMTLGHYNQEYPFVRFSSK